MGIQEKGRITAFASGPRPDRIVVGSTNDLNEFLEAYLVLTRIA